MIVKNELDLGSRVAGEVQSENFDVALERTLNGFLNYAWEGHPLLEDRHQAARMALAQTLAHGLASGDQERQAKALDTLLTAIEVAGQAR